MRLLGGMGGRGRAAGRLGGAREEASLSLPESEDAPAAASDGPFVRLRVGGWLWLPAKLAGSVGGRGMVAEAKRPGVAAMPSEGRLPRWPARWRRHRSGKGSNGRGSPLF